MCISESLGNTASRVYGLPLITNNPLPAIGHVVNEDLTMLELKSQGIFFKMRYYSGSYHKELSETFAARSLQRNAQMTRILNSSAPDNLITHTDNCRLAQGFSKEVSHLNVLLLDDKQQLKANTQALFFLARWFFQCVQWFMKKDATITEIPKENLEKLIKGQYKQGFTPFGVKIGQTDITGKQFSLYALPETNFEGLTFSGSTAISLAYNNIGKGSFEIKKVLDEEGHLKLSISDIYYSNEDCLKALIHVALDFLNRENVEYLEVNVDLSNNNSSFTDAGFYGADTNKRVFYKNDLPFFQSDTNSQDRWWEVLARKPIISGYEAVLPDYSAEIDVESVLNNLIRNQR